MNLSLKRDRAIAIITAARLGGGPRTGLQYRDVYETANSCSSHPLLVTEADLDGASTIYAAGGCDCFRASPANDTCGSWCDTRSFALAVTRDGRIATIEEWSDSSGHG